MKLHAIKAEEEFGPINQYFKNLKDQSKFQENILETIDKTINEINRTRDENTSLNLTLIEKNTAITGFINVLNEEEVKWSCAETKVKLIAQQLLSVISPESNENFEVSFVFKEF